MTKEQLREEIISYYKDEYDINEETLTKIVQNDMFEEFDNMTDILDPLNIAFISVDYYKEGMEVLCTTYSKKIGHSIILEWECRTEFDSIDDFVDYVYSLYEEAKRLS